MGNIRQKEKDNVKEDGHASEPASSDRKVSYLKLLMSLLNPKEYNALRQMKREKWKGCERQRERIPR